MSALALALAVLPTVVPPPAPWQPPPAPVSHDVGRDLAERDSFGAFPNLHVSDRLVIKWGDAVDLHADGVSAIAGALETSWTLFVDERGMAPPLGSDAWLLNVYVGNSGAPAPSISEGLLGYFSTDDLGAPLIVMQPSVFSRWSPKVDTATHELFHALQNAEYGATGTAWRWYSEATATWAEEELWDPTSAAGRVPSYGTTPWLPIDHTDRDHPDWNVATRAYGAFLFPRFLTERLDDPLLVQDALPRFGTALDAFDEVLAERGEDMARLFGEFAVANATWDYERQEAYRDAANSSWSPDGYVVARASSLGRTGWREPPLERRPQAWSWDLVRVDSPEDGVLHARFRSLAPCDVASWVHVVTEGPDGVASVPLVEGGRQGSLDLAVGGEERVFLAMAFTGPQGGGGFSYQYVMQVNGDPIAEAPEPSWPSIAPTCEDADVEPSLPTWQGGCSVAGETPVGGLWGLLLLSAAGGSRRRRWRSAPAPPAARSPGRSAR